ncbi:hypothetical protein, partial [Actinomadura sp. HBU206391]|uniref:hypothetical protein n=1 Tax=Actinomadura sp. HBU206391 TaxID=2731692 RepID=UPI0016503D08
ATYEDLKTELSILEDPCARRMRLELAAMQGGATKQLPFNVAAMASTWRLHPALMTLPLPLKINVERGEQSVDWLCFWPTNRVKLENHPPAVGRPGYDGLVVYHIHRLPLRSLNIPSAVRAVVLKALREWDRQRERSAAPVLIPELAAALQANRRTFTPEGERFLLGLGGVALLAIFGWVAIEAGIIVGLGAVAKSGLAGLAASPELFTGAIATAARLAKDLWPIISQVQYSLPR